jgi:thermitase
VKETRHLKDGLLVVLAVALALPLLLGATPVRGSPPDQPPSALGRILVKFEPGTSPGERAAVHRVQGGRPLRVIPGVDVEVVSVPERAEEAMAAGYARQPHVAYAEPDYVAYAMGDPQDPLFIKQWGLDNDGQEYDGRSGTADADIDAPEAWDLATGSAEITIAILDSGIDQDHPDLAGKLVGNYDFTGSSTVDDDHGHGTHVAGIAAAVTNNGEGVAGIGRDSSLLNVKVMKVFDDTLWGSYSWIADGIVWATDNGAHVISMSLGGYNRSRTLQAAVDYAWNQGVVLAAAAGNDGSSRRLYPAAYAGCIAVAATDDDDQRVDEPGWWASNYGDWVDVAAPGLYVYSTFPNHPYFIGKSLSYDYGSGTSMATPFVAGLAGLLLAQDTSRTNAQVRALIEDTADPVPGTGTYWSHGRINACNAVGGSCDYGGAEPPPQGTVHVSAIEMWASTAGKNIFVSTRVTVVDENLNAVSGATVDLQTTLPDGSAVYDSGDTDVDGTVTLQVKSRQTGTYTSEVIDVTHAPYTYDSSANEQTGGSLDVP